MGVRKVGQQLLDMALDARMQRAREMGFDTDEVWYHGTTKDIDAFDMEQSGRGSNPSARGTGVWLTKDPDLAQTYTGGYGSGGTIYPVYVRKGDMAEVDVQGGLWNDIPEDSPFLVRDGGVTVEDADLLRELGEVSDASKLDRGTVQSIRAGDVGAWDTNTLAREAKERWHDSVLMRNVRDAGAVEDYNRIMDVLAEKYPGINQLTPGTKDHYEATKAITDADWETARALVAERAMTPRDNMAVFDPSNIRSVNAAFDPAKSDSPNLLAGGAAAAVGLGAATQGEDAEAGVLGAATRELSERLAKRFPDVDFSVSVGSDGIRLNKVVVPEAQRGQGIGSAFMGDLNSYADESGLPVVLTADGDFGGSKSGQRRFYKRMGFVDNAGRNKDFSFTESMIRSPKERGNINPMLASAMAGVSAGATATPTLFERIVGLSQDAGEAAAPVVEGIFDAIDMPWRGYLGATRAAGGLLSGEGFDTALNEGVRQIRQPVEVTADQIGGEVVDQTGSPSLGTAANLMTLLGGPI